MGGATIAICCACHISQNIRVRRLVGGNQTIKSQARTNTLKRMIVSPEKLIKDGILITNGKGKPAQVGYDCTVASIWRVDTNGGDVGIDTTIIPDYNKVELSDSRHWSLVPGHYQLELEQGCNLPSGYAGTFRHRSSVLRCGGIITSGLYDPGFQAENMGAFLSLSLPLVIKEGARVAQFVVQTAETDSMYDGQWQNNKNQPHRE